MSDRLLALARLAHEVDIEQASEPTRVIVDEAARASMLCSVLGITRERWVLGGIDGARSTGACRRPGELLGELFGALSGVAALATLGGAADLDPLDSGPSHSALPATLACCAASRLVPTDVETQQRRIGSGVMAGILVSLAIRRSLSGARPGVGFHSPGIFGTLAAAAGAARVLDLGPEETANALGIALTRSSGLAVNSAATRIGLTHFGWGTAHGLESALLAAEGWEASHDVERALETLAGGAKVDIDALSQVSHFSPDSLLFKHYPCNIYLNPIVSALEDLGGQPLDGIEIRLPWVPHLDSPAPSGIREVRNSAQAVAAISVAAGTSYGAFSGPAGTWTPSAEVTRLIDNVTVEMDKSAPTRLGDAVVGIRARRGQRWVLDVVRSTKELVGWGAEHAATLLGGDADTEVIDALYAGSYGVGFDYVEALYRDPAPAESSIS